MHEHDEIIDVTDVRDLVQDERHVMRTDDEVDDLLVHDVLLMQIVDETDERCVHHEHIQDVVYEADEVDIDVGIDENDDVFA